MVAKFPGTYQSAAHAAKVRVKKETNRNPITISFFFVLMLPPISSEVY
jgi:hypothetical protein